MSIEVKAGQIWADKDKRRVGRQIRVEKIEDSFAQVTVKDSGSQEFKGKASRIKLDRFDRLRLIKDVEEERGSSELEVENEEKMFAPIG